MAGEWEDIDRLIAERAGTPYPGAPEPSADDLANLLLELHPAQFDRWLRHTVAELHPAAERADRLRLGAASTPDHPLSVAAAELRAWYTGTDPAEPIILRAAGPPGSETVALLRLREYALRLAASASRLREHAEAAGWTVPQRRLALRHRFEPVAKALREKVLDRYTTGVSWERVTAELYTAAGCDPVLHRRLTNAEAWPLAVIRALRQGGQPPVLAVDTGPPRTDTRPAVPPPAAEPGWEQALAQAVAALAPAHRAGRRAELVARADTLWGRMQELRALVDPAARTTVEGAPSPAPEPLINRRGRPTDSRPALDWAHLALARCRAVTTAGHAADAETDAGLLTTARLLVDAQWAGGVALGYLSPGVDDDTVLNVAARHLQHDRARLLAALGGPAAPPSGGRRTLGASSVLAPRQPTAPPSGDLLGRLYAASAEQLARYLSDVLTTAADKADPHHTHLGRIARDVAAALPEPAGPDQVESACRVHPQQEDGDLLSYAAVMCGRAASRAAAALHEVNGRMLGNPWEGAFAAEPDLAEGLRALRLLGDRHGLPADWLDATWQSMSPGTCRWPLGETVRGPAGDTDLTPISGAPVLRWQVAHTAHGNPAEPPPGIAVNGHGLIVWRDGQRGYHSYDPDSGRERRLGHGRFVGYAARTVFAESGGQPFQVDVLTDAEVSGRPLPGPAPAPAPLHSHDGLVVQAECRAGALTYHAAGTAVRAVAADGALCWEVRLEELLGDGGTRPDRYPAAFGDEGFGVRAMTAADHRLYLLTTGRRLLCLEQPAPGEPPSRHRPATLHQPPGTRLSERVERLCGYRYVARVSFGEEIALVFDTEPFTAERVYRQLRERGYQLVSVSASGRGWVAKAARLAPERIRVYVASDDDAKWYTMFDWPTHVALSHAHRRWFRSSKPDSIYDDDRYLYVSEEIGRRVARAMGAEPATTAEFEDIRRHTGERWQRSQRRPKDLYETRRQQFAPRLPALRAQAERLAERLPAREEVTGSYRPEPRRAAEHPVAAAALDEPFALVRFQYGFFGKGTRYLSQRVAVGTPDGPVTLDVEIDVFTRVLEYQAVTPFCPEEGYLLDAHDRDPIARSAKIDRYHLGVFGSGQYFPVSPYRLRVHLAHDAPAGSAAARFAEDLWLELAFPDGAAYRAASYRTAKAGRVYEQWVPVAFGLLPVVAGLAPEWVSIQVPEQLELLAEVTATLRHLPDEPRPSAVHLFEE
jgi:phosphoserine phosphatase